MSARSKPESRGRDANASRRALLDAASTLFDERGYDGATIRDIGERAGVDPALIARYYSGKAGLYLAVLGDEDRANALRPPELEPRAVAHRLLTRWDERGRTPMARALADPEPGDDVRAQLGTILETRLLGPLSSRLAEQGADAPRLRAELLVAMLLGIWVSRANGTLAEVAGTSREELIDVLAPALELLAEPVD